MSNKTQLQTNNTQLASLIQTLQGKAAGGGSASGRGSCEVTIINYGVNPVTLTVYSPDHSATADQLAPFCSEVITMQVDEEITRTYKKGDFLYFDGTTARPNNGTYIGGNLVVLSLMDDDEIEVG